MDIKRILRATDHTNLRPTAAWNEIRKTLDEALEFECASACIPPSFVSEAADYVSGDLAICTVVGFPNGYSTTASKLFETEDALEDGADEIDTVINLGWVKDGLWDLVEDEIGQIRDLAGDALLKVIVECSELTEGELIRLCGIVTGTGADFIKTSTGFSGGGAEKKDILLMKAHLGPQVRIKASGGIRTLEDAESFLDLGASRLGASALVGLARSYFAEN